MGMTISSMKHQQAITLLTLALQLTPVCTYTFIPGSSRYMLQALLLKKVQAKMHREVYGSCMLQEYMLTHVSMLCISFETSSSPVERRTPYQHHKDQYFRKGR